MMKRLMSLLLCVSLLLALGTQAAFAATFSDVPQSNDYYEAIDVLSDFGIILGDAGTGTFRPDAEISREEFSVIVTRILGVSNIKPDLMVLPFKDVTSATCDEWSIIATKVAYDMGIISGYGDGNFGPKDPVTYEQVVKMLVCALGYESSAKENGGWPTGYLKVANDIGMTKDAAMAQSKNAPRGIVAQLVYNALEIDLMEPNGADSYIIRTGHNLLTDKLGYTYGKGVLTGIPNLAITHAGKRFAADEVEMDSDTIYKVGTTKAADYFGYAAEYYYKTKGSERTLVAFMPLKDNKVYTIPADQIEKIDEKEIEYYAEKDASKTEKLTLTGATYMYNGSAKPLNQIAKPSTGDVTIIDRDNDETADLIMVSDARIVVVSALDSTKKLVYNKYDTNEKLDLSTNNDKDIKITKNGTAAQFSAITKGSVLLVSESSDLISVEVITKTVSGTVDAERDGGEILVINDKEYECADAYLDYVSKETGEKVYVGDKVTLYVDANNRVLYSTISATTTKLGYLVAAEENRTDKVTKIKLYNTSNKMTILTAAETVNIDGAAVKYDKIIDKLTASASLTNKDSAAKNADISQLIKYTTASDGKIDSITTMTESGDVNRNLVLNKPYDETGAVYYTSTKTFKDTNVSLNASTKVFLIPSDRYDDDNYAVKTYTGLTNSKNYKFEVYDKSDTGVAGVIVAYGNKSGSGTSLGTQVAVIKSISSVLNSEKVAVDQVVLMINGTESKRETVDNKLMKNFKSGDAVRYATNAQGKLTMMVKVFDPTDEAFTFVNKGDGKRYYTENPYNSSNNSYYHTTICGVVYSRDDQRILISTGDMDSAGNLDESADMYPVLITDKTKYYLYDKSAKTPFNATDITADDIAGYVDAKTGASKVMVYMSYTDVKFVYIINE